ncbi:MAG: RsmD family RNA methyltransferase [Puniceicoccales bacterium]|jgi:16S rRNA (guanine966-N2)-methyltransferase|nr:RsmD family RNA methyltransferase [Puniceicoccales bacterium]
MRISGGKARGIQLSCPQVKALRPTTDALREAVFSAISHDVAGCNFLDLCAGTGSYGLEAMSRGANGGVFVEENDRLFPHLLENLQRVSKSAGFNPQSCQLLRGDIFKLDPGRFSFAQLIFLDPPYEQFRARADAFISLLSRFLSVAELGVLELPADTSPTLPGEFICTHTLGKTSGKNSPKALIFRRYGAT